jgi:serine/threonine protein phosphatase PrpC
MYQAQEVRSGTSWRIVTASVIGPGHVRANLPNQDRLIVHPVDARSCLYAVADGAGSRSRSDQGAEFAVTAASEAADSVFKSRRLPPGLNEWCTAMEEFRAFCNRRFDRYVNEAAQEIRASEASPTSVEKLRGEFATTVLTVVAAPPCFGYFSIGDCFLVVDRQPGEPALVVASPEREHAGATTFMTSRDRDHHTSTGVIVDDRIRAIALCSDGVAEGMLSSRQGPDGKLQYVAPPEFRTYFDHFGNSRIDRNGLSAKLASADFAATSSDDKTIVMAVRQT